MLRNDWEFSGVVIGDQAATGGAQVLHFTSPNNLVSTKQAIEAGLDVIFQSSVQQYAQFWPAFERGMIDPRAIDRAVSRVLKLKFELGLFEHPYVDPDDRGAQRRIAGTSRYRARCGARVDHASQERRRHAADQENRSQRRRDRRRMQIEARLGGYSGDGNDKISILQGIRRKLGSGASVRYAAGPGRFAIEYVPVPAANLVTVAGGKRMPGLAGRVLRQQHAHRRAAREAPGFARSISDGRSTPLLAAFRSTGIPCAGRES